MTQPPPDFATIRTWYESNLSDLILNVERDEATPEHVQAFELIAGIYQVALGARTTDTLAANAEHIRRMDAERRQYIERETSALERIATALEALARKETTP